MENHPPDIKTKYRRLLKQYHPDLGTDAADIAHREEMTKRLNEWYAGSKAQPVVQRAPVHRREEDEFSLYKKALRIYSKVHPDRWHAYCRREPKAGDLFGNDVTRNMQRIEVLIGRLTAAERVLRGFLERFPESLWRGDVEEKLGRAVEIHQRFESMRRALTV